MDAAGIEYWYVGGCVRDWATGAASRDIDIIAKASLEQLEAVTRGEAIHCKFPHILLDDLEILPTDDIMDDLQRRDFTVNAMALSKGGDLIDPCGGLKDAQDRVFRMTRPDAMAEDPLRMMRACRLAARLGWSIEPETEKAIAAWRHMFGHARFFRRQSLRVGLELKKAFDDPAPSLFLRSLKQRRLLRYALPLLDAAPKPVFEAALKACDKAPAGRSDLRMAALLGPLAAKGGKAIKKDIAKQLERIKWDLASSNFGRSRQPFASSGIAAAIASLGIDLRDKSALLRSAESGEFGGLSAAGLLELRRSALGLKCGKADLSRIQAWLLERGARPDLDKDARRALLRFHGMSKKRIKRIIEAAR